MQAPQTSLPLPLRCRAGAGRLQFTTPSEGDPHCAYSTNTPAAAAAEGRTRMQRRVRASAGTSGGDSEYRRVQRRRGGKRRSRRKATRDPRRQPERGRHFSCLFQIGRSEGMSRSQQQRAFLHFHSFSARTRRCCLAAGENGIRCNHDDGVSHLQSQRRPSQASGEGAPAYPQSLNFHFLCFSLTAFFSAKLIKWFRERNLFLSLRRRGPFLRSHATHRDIVCR